jgi:DnaK suppressor protein
VNVERWRKLLGAERGRLEEALGRYRAESAADPGELAALDQHQADGATDRYEREEAESRIAELEERLAAVGRAEQRLEDGTYGTSVESGEPIRDLASIPLSRSDPPPEADPQEVDDEIALPIAGEAYEGEGGAPAVGRPDPDDVVVDRLYRPE